MRFLIIIILFFSLAFPQLLPAQNNVVDLRGKDFSQEIFTLNHLWQMEYGQLLSADEMQAIPDKYFIEVPNHWTGENFKGTTLPATGYATYYLKVLVDKDQENLSINARITSTNYKLFINNQFLGEIGKVGNSKDSAEPMYTNKIYKLPSHHGEIEIIYHVSNFHYRKGGMGRAPFFGTTEKLIESRFKKIAVSLFLIGSIFFMGLYHLGSNFFRFRSKMALYFALVCFFTILRTLSINEYVLIEFMNFPWWLNTRIELISFYLILAFTMKFLYHLFPAAIPDFFTKTPVYIAYICSLIALFTPILYGSYTVLVMQFVTVTAGIGLLYFMIKESFKGDKEIIIALLGLAVLFGVTVFEILVHHSQIIGELIFAFGIFFYLFSHVIIMAMRLNTTYESIDELSTALKTSNIELEEKVQERTQQLDVQNIELLQSNEDLRRINEEKNGLIHVVAHDLKSPLNTNIGLIQLLKMEGNLSGNQGLYLNNLEKTNNKGLNLINDLLILYNLESQQEINSQAVDIPDFLKTLYEPHQNNASLKDIKIKASIAHFNEPFYTDESMLTRILDNLISNAIKFSQPGTQITLNARLESANLYIKIADEGLGILEEEQHKIFKKFQKMSNRPTGDESSSGLGLSIVKELVLRLKGEVGFTSEYGKGSTFWVVLPNFKKSFIV
jgi:signal transduction histidine kinase